MLFEEYLSEEEYLEELNELIFDFIDSLDLEELSEDQAEKLDDLLTFITDMDIEYEDGEEEDLEEDLTEEELNELKKKRVVRGGKIIRRVFCKPGFKAMGGTRCVKMAAKERRVRKKAAKRSARKRKAKSATIQRHRTRSMRIANRIGGK
ncbi:MAG: hypothetical protein RBS24_06695 [Bacilli bacterium]|nr:hypothetical protein [Bacilli bacterium]